MTAPLYTEAQPLKAALVAHALVAPYTLFVCDNVTTERREAYFGGVPNYTWPMCEEVTLDRPWGYFPLVK